MPIVTGGLAGWLEYGLNLGIGLLALGLAALSWTAYRRNREPKLRWVAAAFLLFSLKGWIVLTEPLLIGAGYGYEAELIEHSAPALSLVALALFYAAVTRED